MKKKKRRLNSISISNSDRINILSYIKAIDKSGKDPNIAIKNKISEYKMRKKKKLRRVCEKVAEITSRGGRLIDGLYEAGIINQKEYYILLNSKDGLAAGIEKVINQSKNTGKLMFGVLMFLGPIVAIAAALLIFHGPVKDIVEGVTAPMREAGATPPPIPNYLVDPHMYILLNIGIWILIISTVLFMKFLKETRPKEYIKSIPIMEQEYSIDILESLKTLISSGGMNLSDAAVALSKGASDSIKKKIYEKIIERTRSGKISLSETLEEFGFSYNTISALKIGEDGGDINAGIEIALEDLKERYKRNISLYLKASFWGGQFGMMMVAMKPMVDILMLMSVGQMNFQL